jgi:sterol 3beta-glucosyltransferase
MLKAKIPPIIVSIIADQTWWWTIIEQEKLGAYIRYRKLTSKKLIDAIEKTRSADIVQNVQTFGEQIRQDNGLKKTMDLLEKYFSA